MGAELVQLDRFEIEDRSSSGSVGSMGRGIIGAMSRWVLARATCRIAAVLMSREHNTFSKSRHCDIVRDTI